MNEVEIFSLVSCVLCLEFFVTSTRSGYGGSESVTRPKQTSSQSLTCTFSDQQDETKKVGKILKNETAVPGAQFLVRYSSSQSEASTTGTRSGVREPVGIGGVSHPPLAKATNWNRESPTELFYDVVALCGEAREYRKWNRRGASDITSRCFPCGDFFGFVSFIRLFD